MKIRLTQEEMGKHATIKDCLKSKGIVSDFEITMQKNDFSKSEATFTIRELEPENFVSTSIDREQIEFHVGDVVQLKYKPETKLFILEVSIHTCYADVKQVWYTGRLFSTSDKQFFWKDLLKLCAIEVEAIPNN